MYYVIGFDSYGSIVACSTTDGLPTLFESEEDALLDIADHIETCEDAGLDNDLDWKPIKAVSSRGNDTTPININGTQACDIARQCGLTYLLPLTSDMSCRYCGKAASPKSIDTFEGFCSDSCCTEYDKRMHDQSYTYQLPKA